MNVSGAAFLTIMLEKKAVLRTTTRTGRFGVRFFSIETD